MSSSFRRSVRPATGHTLRQADTGDSKVETFALSPTDPADDYDWDYQPSRKTHQSFLEDRHFASRQT